MALCGHVPHGKIAVLKRINDNIITQSVNIYHGKYAGRKEIINILDFSNNRSVRKVFTRSTCTRKS